MELLARVYDHAEHKCRKGFTMATRLGMVPDGYKVLSPVGFNLLSSAKKATVYQEISVKIQRHAPTLQSPEESLLTNRSGKSS